jgi:SAM-dependent methyltransferase
MPWSNGGVAEKPSIWAARQYGAVAGVYDTLMTGVPHDEWLSRIERAARERGKAPKSALDCACGTGLVTELLWRRGYRPLVGFDLSPAMVAIAKTKATRLQASGLQKDDPPRYVISDAAQLDLGPDARFDLVVSLFDSLNYIVDPSALGTAFRRLYRHTAPGGVLAFDLNSVYALSQGLFTQSNHLGPVQHDWHAHWDAETRLCRVDMGFWVEDAETGERRHFTETHLQRAYGVPEIRELLTAAGYVRMEAFGSYGDLPPGPRSDRVLYVAERAEE